MHYCRARTALSEKPETDMESVFKGPGGHQKPAEVPKCFMGESEQKVVRPVLERGVDADALGGGVGLVREWAEACESVTESVLTRSHQLKPSTQKDQRTWMKSW